ncbi:hypothetical protein FPZ49_05000 [Paenibacillus cremeus]|uniref:Uncharacterized protein n=1 Tax=Paenibacillus cremeus TaxID=2163881 RepID=A0A559KGD5_9BACL|nr:hypothetical protein FPZ49_05000 [Paenibacillus cremeus]
MDAKTVAIDGAASEAVLLDQGITKAQFSPTIKLSVNVSESLGQTFAASLKLGAGVSGERDQRAREGEII